MNSTFLFMVILILIYWFVGFRIKFLIKNKDIDKHNEIFSKTFLEHSIKNDINYVKLLFNPNKLKEFEINEILVLSRIAVMIFIIVSMIVLYPFGVFFYNLLFY